MMIFNFYHNLTNLDLVNVLYLTLGITGISLLFSSWKYFKNRKNIDLKENVKSIFSVIPLQILLTFFCLSFILYSSAKIYLDIDFTELQSIQKESTNFGEFVINEGKSLILNFTEEPLKDYAGWCFVTIAFGLASLWYLLTNLSKDEKRKTSIIKFSFYFFIIGFLWFYQNVDPLQEKLDYVIKAHQSFVKEVRDEKIAIYRHNIEQAQSICNILLTIINFLFISVFDDWLIINGYRILTNGVTSKFHTIKIRIVDSLIWLSVSFILSLSGFTVITNLKYLSSLLNESMPNFLLYYGVSATVIGTLSFLFVLLSPVSIIIFIPIFILTLLYYGIA